MSHSASKQARQATPIRAPQGLQVLRGQGESDRLQGHPEAEEFRLGAREDHAAAHLGKLRSAPAAADPRDPACAHDRAAGPDGRLRRYRAPMKIILLEDVPTLGRRGEVRDVADGYARNYLLPHKLALNATTANLKNLEGIKARQESQAAKSVAQSQAQAQVIAGLHLAVSRQASDEDRLFGSVGRNDIAAFLTQHGVEVERRRIELDEPIKTLGEFSVPIRLHPDVTAQLKVTVTRE